jgi:hypothetical protein
MSNTGTRAKFGHDEQEFLKKFPCPLIATNMKGAYSIPAHSDDFDPNTAKEDELTKNGVFWRRPAATDSPALMKAWQRVFSRKWLAKDRIVPKLEPQAGKTHNLRKPLRPVTDQNVVNSAWAGAGIRGGGQWNGILGVWKIPTVSKPSEPQGTEGGWNSSSWLGIDGFDVNIVSNDVLQAGIEQKVDSQGNASYVAWFEWFAPAQQGSPAYINQTNIPNFAVKPGDQVLCLVNFFSPFSFLPNIGIITFANETTGKNFMMILWAPPGATATGNTIEWIMEAPDGCEPISALPKFTPVAFTSAVASGAGGVDVGNPQNGDTANIETTAGKLLTSVTVGNETVTIDFIG